MRTVRGKLLTDDAQRPFAGVTCGLALALFASWTTGCAGPDPGPSAGPNASPNAGASVEAQGQVHSFSDNWGRADGCNPHGDLLTLQGTITVRPLGKGSDGAALRVTAQDEWIVSYGATGVLLEHDGKRVEVTGRACVKQYEAVYGQHFDLGTLVELR